MEEKIPLKLILSIMAVLFFVYYQCFRDNVQTPAIMGTWVSSSIEVANFPIQAKSFTYTFGKTKNRSQFIKVPNGGKYASHEIHPFNSNSNLFDHDSDNYYSSKGEFISFFKKVGDSNYKQYLLHGKLESGQIKIISFGNSMHSIKDVIRRK